MRRLVFDDLVAVGAELASVAGSEIIEADRIWLCAGAIGSPVVLLRSGIGPKADLAAAGIDCVADVSGVGQGLVDHPAISIVSRTRAEIEHLDTVMMEVGVRYSSGHAQGSFNDMQLTPGAIRNLPGWPDVFAVMTGVYAPLSVGHVSLDPARPWGTPIICPNFLSEPADLERAMDGLRRAWQVLHTAPLAAAVEEVFELTDEEICNDQALASYAQRRCASFHHPVGTARMGPADDPASVVNHTGRVRYTEGLHVVDASIMPTIPRANTNIPTIMLAEHVIDLVRDE